MTPREPVVLFVTVPSAEVATTLARAVVGEHLAACVNVVPGLRSLYWWQGAVHDDPELLLVLKSCRDRVPALRERILGLHPYSVPELVVLPIIDGSEPYLEWIRESTR
jgi:periplasmic divalent cation tolerance protein